MDSRRLGVAVSGRDSREVLERVQKAEEMGIQAAWLATSGARQLDSLTLFASAASSTKRILLGTCIVSIWTRHPVVMAQQARVIDDLAPGRFRLGIGPSHRATTQEAFGLDYHAPLSRLSEYLRILKALLQQGKVDFDGRFYRAHARTVVKPGAVVMASALRRKSFELCGAEADGAITWVCPRSYIKQVAVPALETGARRAGRAVPPLIAHAPICAHENRDEVLAATRADLGYIVSSPNYMQMFIDAGYPEAAETKAWSDRMIDAVVLHGNESRVKSQLQDMFTSGASEIIVSPILAGQDKVASYQHTMQIVADVSKGISNK